MDSKLLGDLVSGENTRLVRAVGFLLIQCCKVPTGTFAVVHHSMRIWVTPLTMVINRSPSKKELLHLVLFSMSFYQFVLPAQHICTRISLPGFYLGLSISPLSVLTTLPDKQQIVERGENCAEISSLCTHDSNDPAESQSRLRSTN